MPGASTAARSGVGVGNGSDGAGIEGTRLTPSLLRMGVLRLLLSCPTWHPAEGTVFVKIGRNQEKIQAIEQKIDDITDNFRQNQIDRMREGHCNVESSILYSEMLTDYERIGDHMLNIGEAYDAIQWNSDKAAALAEE